MKRRGLLFEMAKKSQMKKYMRKSLKLIQSLEKDLQQYELSMLLNGPHDKNSAILEIHPGAGGTESQDWGSMLLRMACWAENGYRVETVDYQDGDEAGIKSVTLSIEGLNAYGYLFWKGVHRLRSLPFDAVGNVIHHSVSYVVPQMDGDIDIEINPDDLKVDV